jgi:hypothetical protein
VCKTIGSILSTTKRREQERERRRRRRKWRWKRRESERAKLFSSGFILQKAESLEHGDDSKSPSFLATSPQRDE